MKTFKTEYALRLKLKTKQQRITFFYIYICTNNWATSYSSARLDRGFDYLKIKIDTSLKRSTYLGRWKMGMDSLVKTIDG